MGTIVLKVKSEKAAQMLADFLQTIEYIEDIELNDNSLEPSEAPIAITKGDYNPDEKPSHFAGIWKNRKHVDSKKLRQKAWQRK